MNLKLDHLIIGLGNPGLKYQLTRHNVGFLCLDALAHELRLSFEESGSLSKKLRAHVLECQLADKQVLILKPQTFMNLSGESLARLYALHSHFKECPLTVIHDEVQIPLGKIRVKMGGGDAGHNGLKSLRATLGHGDFYRIRVGIAPPTETDTNLPPPLRDFVLEAFSKDDENMLAELIPRSVDTLRALIGNGLSSAQQVASKIGSLPP